MIPTEDIISIVKNTITASIKCNTYRGYIGWSSCDNICMDMHDCLDMCAETLEMRGYMVALEAATYILVSGVKLASHADSSSGMLTDVIMCTYELIEKCAKEIEKQDKQMREQAFALIIKEAKKSVFDGWTDWRYDLLKSFNFISSISSSEYPAVFVLPITTGIFKNFPAPSSNP